MKLLYDQDDAGPVSIPLPQLIAAGSFAAFVAPVDAAPVQSVQQVQDTFAAAIAKYEAAPVHYFYDLFGLYPKGYCPPGYQLHVPDAASQAVIDAAGAGPASHLPVVEIVGQPEATH